jgi:uridine kinase
VIVSMALKVMSKIVAIAGGSGSGKTTLAKALVGNWPASVAGIVSQDSYYFDQSANFDRDGGKVNFDHPSSIDFKLLANHIDELRKGKAINVPIYDFTTHSRSKETKSFTAHPIVFIDGTLILSQAYLRSFFDCSVFIRTPEETRFARRLRRDVEERGRTPEGVKAQFAAQVKPMHDEFVEPSSAFANVILDGKKTIKALLRELELDGSLDKLLQQNHPK